MEASHWLSSPYILAAVTVTVLLSLCVWLGVTYDRQRNNKSAAGIKDEPVQDKPMFESLHNFRQVGGSCIYNRYGQKIRDQLIFRSSRTDFLIEEEADKFLQLGIKTIIDLRTKEECRRAGGSNVIGKLYPPYLLKGSKQGQNNNDPRKRIFIDLVTREYVMTVFNQVNFIVRCATPMILLVDWLFCCHLTLKLYSHLVINRQSLAEWYMDILEHAKPEVAVIMRLLLEDDNVPVLINCAHGKDRTGMIIALILGCLEVEDEVIAQDYSMSEAGLAPVRSRLVREAVGKHGFNIEFTTATIDTMKDLLSELSKRYGGVPGYLSAAGFTADEQQAMKNIFLELF